jgi:hypothetical protein
VRVDVAGLAGTRHRVRVRQELLGDRCQHRRVDVIGRDQDHAVAGPPLENSRVDR